MELTTIIKLQVGDSSQDGHNITRDFFFKTTPELAESIRATYEKGCEHFGWTADVWEEFCSDFGCSEFPVEMVRKLMLFYETDSDIKAKVPTSELWSYRHFFEKSPPNEEEEEFVDLDGKDYAFFYHLFLIAGNRDYLDKFEPLHIPCYPIGGYGLYSP